MLKIYKDKAEFDAREDKNVNGISQKFYDEYHNMDNLHEIVNRFEGCWNCFDCDYCKNCSHCCRCRFCEDSDNLIECIKCNHCDNCTSCQHCKDCSYCLSCVNSRFLNDCEKYEGWFRENANIHIENNYGDINIE